MVSEGNERERRGKFFMFHMFEERLNKKGVEVLNCRQFE